MHFKEFIKPELMVLIPVLYLVGMGIKRSKVADKWIPLLLGMVSIAISALWVVATTDIAGVKDVANALFVAVTQGVLAAGVSVYLNQLYIQSKKQ